MLYLFVGVLACEGKCRSYGAHFTFACVSPGFHIGLCPHFTLGYAGVPPLQGSLSDCLRLPRVSYRALPSFHPGLCGSVALSGLFVVLFAVSPGFHIGLRPHFTLGYAGVPPFQGSLSYWLCLPRVSYWALPSFHPGLCRSTALSGLVVVLAVCPQGFISGFALISPWALQECRPFRALCRIICVYPGFHIGLCPHFTLGYAGVSPLQGSLSDWAFAVLCRGIVFVKCVWVCVNGLLRLCFCI